MSSTPISPLAPMGGAAGTAPGTAPGASAGSAAGTGAGEDRLAKEFEAVFLSQFVDQMMKTVDYGPAAGGQGAEIWRSFLSQAMAEQLSERGGLGLSANIAQMLNAYRR
ncbi:rod-binding protein [Antarcticimicrobium luteum]|uniref:Flagellar protein FlgJ N-terminal domain-containing protein n=1 Tax=Antarcticimicrobium luteum TaxID=2547397 RepID=A0A4V3ASE5_9RHOB|nr:rod-binding protein [Antarcticimicrobium luteum]TDK50208.1 hypothetical protein E1832_07305 [Antarcticimicrobium luteum]